MTATVPRQDTPALAGIERIYEAQQRNRAAVASATAAQRIAKLRRLHDAIFARRDEIRAAMWADYQKPAPEVDLSEIYPVVAEIRHAIRHLKSWMKPRRVSTRLVFLGSTSRIVYEPKGVTLIIAPWNFPFNLLFGPLVSAIAAGNTAVLKPSEMTAESNACSERIVRDVFAEDEVAVVSGDATVATALLRKKWDHIFFTGSPAVGKIVMKAAAEHLTSVTLELGGKSPVIVDSTADLGEAASKIAWGKFFNSGQICIAPDYVLVQESVAEPFGRKLREAIDALGGETSRGIIVNEHHAARVKKLFDDAIGRGAHVLAGGGFHGRAVEPTVLTNVPGDSQVMTEEIFGPILPITTYRTLEDAFAIINAREHPLVLYVFSRDRKTARRIVASTRAGGTAINHTMIHFYELDLPFGGVGASGFGRSHGFAGFEAFSNARGVLDQHLRFSAIELLFPPYGAKWKQKLIDLTVRWF